MLHFQRNCLNYVYIYTVYTVCTFHHLQPHVDEHEKAVFAYLTLVADEMQTI